MEEIRNGIENENNEEVITEDVASSGEQMLPADASVICEGAEGGTEASPESAGDPKASVAGSSPVSEPVIKWSFASQVASDRKELRKSGRNGALVYAVIMTVMFVICFAALAVLLITGYGSDPSSNVGSIGTPGGDTTLTQIYSEAAPSVVTVSVTFNNGSGIGSGFIYTNDGYIITNYHVIDDAKTIHVIMYDGSQHKADLVGGDELSDVAVLKISAPWLTPAKIGNSDALAVGEEVIAIGTPIGLEYAGTLTHGIISGLDRVVRLYEDSGLLDKTMTLIQTNTILNPGNSGGPLLNMSGEVVGINTLKYISSSDGSVNFEGVGFSIPINSAKLIVDEIIETGSYSGSGDVADKGVQLGITCSTVYKDVQTQINGQIITPAANGVIITAEPLEGLPAAGKLKVYDIIISIDGVATPTTEDLRSRLYTHKIGDTLKFEVIRNGKKITVDITL